MTAARNARQSTRVLILPTVTARNARQSVRVLINPVVNGTATPSVIALTATTPAPTATGTGSGTATPAAIARTVVVPAPTTSNHPVLWEPFHDYTTNSWALTGSPTATLVTGRNTAQSPNLAANLGSTIASNASVLTYTIPSVSESDWLVFGTAWKSTSIADTEVAEFTSDTNATRHVQLWVGASGDLQVRSSGSIRGTSSTGLIVANTWYYLEIRVHLGDSTAGSWEVRLNGVTAIALTAGDTKNGGTKTVFDAVRLTPTNNLTSTANYDDLYLDTGSAVTFLGDPSSVPATATPAAITLSVVTPAPTATGGSAINGTATPSTIARTVYLQPPTVTATATQTGELEFSVIDFRVQAFASAIPTPPPPIGDPIQPVVYCTLWSRFGTTLLSTLDETFDVQWQEVINETGSGRFSWPLSNVDCVVEEGQLVKCHIYNQENVFNWRVESVEVERISQEEEFGQIVKVTGRGLGMRFGDAMIWPPHGVEQVPPSEIRSFSFASPDYDDSAWAQATQVAPFGDLTTEWTGVIDGELTPAPFGWPVRESWFMLPYWIWTDISFDAQGISYFRRQITLDAEIRVNIVATGDNFWTLYLNGIALLGDNTFAEAWNEHRRAELSLPAGTHTFAAVINNIRPSPAALLVMVYHDTGFTCIEKPDIVDPDGDVHEQSPDCTPNDPLMVMVSDEQWKVLGYPAVEPGMTPGQVMNQLLDEAHARWQLMNIVPDFDYAYDSEGVPWQAMPEVGATIGDSMLDILKTMTEGGWCDWWLHPVVDGVHTLSMYVAEGRGNAAGAVEFAGELNISDITHATAGRNVNRMLVKYGGGLFAVDNYANSNAIGEIIENFMTVDVSDRAEAERQARRSMEIAGAGEAAITLTHEQYAGPNEKPYVDYKPGDMCMAPDEWGISRPYRILGVTITQDDFGDPVVSLEINRHTYNPEARRDSLFQTIGSGVVGKQLDSEKVDGYQQSGD